ncbi:MAG: DUF1616 domain-containing protein [Thermoplasmata archaeon]|nr:DUF1616 domain-containing protein [Thermoplasmata archaeon]
MADGLLNDLLEGKRYPTDLLIVIIWAIIAAVGTLMLPDGDIARIILAIPLLIFLPGYALVSVLWPEKHMKIQSKGEDSAPLSKGLDNIERVALSFGLSIAIVSLMGLALHYTPLGITLESSLISDLAFVMVFAGLAYLRRSKMPMEERFHLDFSFKSPTIPANRIEKTFILIIAICFIASGITLGYVLTTPSAEQRFSVFYILDANDTAENYPLNITVGDNTSVILGIVCHEYAVTDYAIIIGLEGANITDYNVDWNQPYRLTTNHVARRNISLNHQDVFQERFNFQLNESGRQKMVCQLLINGEFTDYEVHLWVDVRDV